MAQTVTREPEWVGFAAGAGRDGAGTEAASRRSAVRAWTATLVLLCLGTLWLEFRHIASSSPYPLHVDEAFITGPAARTLETGTLHPYSFVYPSLPKYLAAAGMAVGFLRGAARLEVRELRQIDSVTYPFYDTPRVMQTARQLFALLSVIALAATGFAAWLAFQKPAAILLAPLILVTSPLYFLHSWTYLNVDIVGTCFVALTLAACMLGTRRPSIHQSAILPAVLAGFAAGSKYTLALVALPVLLTLQLYLPTPKKIWIWLSALAATAVAFVAVVPYSLIDLPGFLNGLASEAYHYASGHRGFSAEPGIPQLLFYLKHFVSDFGVGGALLAVFGLTVYAVVDWRRAVVLASFPVALLWLLASQRVHFTRNVLSLHPFVAMFAAFGLITVHGWIMGLADGRGRIKQLYRRRAGVIVGLVLVITAVPAWHVAAHLRDRTDSRKLAGAWIQQRIEPEWTIVVPKQLNFDPRGLGRTRRRVMFIDLESARDDNALSALTADVPAPAVIMVPRWGADARFAGQDRAEALNKLAERWQAIRTFGTNPVLVNYSSSTPWGNPAFSVAVLK